MVLRLLKEEVFDILLELRLAHASRHKRWAVVEWDICECRYRAHVEVCCKLLLVVYVYLVDVYPTSIFLSNLVDDGHEHLTGTTPRCVEIDQRRLIAQKLPAAVKLSYSLLKFYFV